MKFLKSEVVIRRDPVHGVLLILRRMLVTSQQVLS